MPTDPTSPTPGRSLVSRRAIIDIVRGATLGSYGVIGLAGGGPLTALGERVGLAPRGVRVAFGSGEDDAAPRHGLVVELDLLVAHGLPIAEVARQVDSAVRYAIRSALGREIERLTIHVDGLRLAPFVVDDLAAAPASGATKRPGRGRRRRGAGGEPAIAPDDLAASGTDVA